MNKFWEFKNLVTSEGAELYLEGDISQVTWYGDEVTPEAFRSELKKCKGDITVHIDSNGGDVFAGVTIYNALKDYSKGKVIVKVDGLAASIASVIAMAGDEIIMSPGSMMMIHNPWSKGAGSSEELRKVADLLDEIKDTIVPIYAERTGLSASEIIDIMDSETWMSAEKAVEKGFADKVLKKKESKTVNNMMSGAFAFNMSATKNAMADFIKKVNNEGETSMAEELEKAKVETVEAETAEAVETEAKDEAEAAEGNVVVAEEVEIKKVNEDGTVEALVDGEEATLTPADEGTKEAIEEIAKEEAEEEVEEEVEEADKIGDAIKALKEENAELKAKLAKLEKAEAKAQAKVNSLENLKAHYASILNMAEEADGGEVNGKEDDKKVDNEYENALREAFKF